MTIISLRSQGQQWNQWKSLNLTHSLDNFIQELSIETTDRFQEGQARWNINGGSIVELTFDNIPVFGGYVTQYNASISEGSHTINVTAKSQSVDMIESSHLGQLFWRDVSPEDIINEVVQPYGVVVVFEAQMSALPPEGFRVAANSNPFSIIKRLAERDGLIVLTTRGGLILITDNPSLSSPPPIQRGVWCSISANHDIGKFQSEIILKTQRKSFNNDFNQKQNLETRVQNNSVDRYRPLIVVENSDVEQEQDLTEYINRRFTGNSVTATVQVKSFFDNNGNLWTPGSMVNLNEPLVDIVQDLVISSVNFSLSEQSGILTTLELKLPDTFSNNGTSAAGARRGTGAFGNLAGAFT